MTHDMSKEDIDQELEHHRQMVHELKRHLHVLELTKAIKGSSTEPSVLNGIKDYIQDIQRHKEQIKELQTLRVQEHESRNEVEYRMLVAEAWDTPEARPSVAAQTRLEHHRLRLGVEQEQAQQIEREIRGALVEQLFRQVQRHFYRTRANKVTIDWNTRSHLFGDAFNAIISSSELKGQSIIVSIEYPRIDSVDQKSIDTVVKCIYLDYSAILRMYIEHFTRQPLRIVDVNFEPGPPDWQADNTDKLASLIDKSEFIHGLFRIFSANLYNSPYATGFREEHHQIGKFVESLYTAVVTISL